MARAWYEQLTPQGKARQGRGYSLGLTEAACQWSQDPGHKNGDKHNVGGAVLGPLTMATGVLSDKPLFFVARLNQSHSASAKGPITRFLTCFTSVEDLPLDSSNIHTATCGQASTSQARLSSFDISWVVRPV